MGVIVSAIIYVLIGVIWWMPWLFGQEWLRLMGWDKKSKKQLTQMKKDAHAAYLTSVVAGLVTAYVLGYVLSMMDVRTISQAVSITVIMWFGFTAMGSLVDYAYAHRPFRLWAINYLYHLVSMVVIACVLVKYF